MLQRNGVSKVSAIVLLLVSSLAGRVAVSQSQEAVQEIVLNDRAYEAELPVRGTDLDRRVRALLAELGFRPFPGSPEVTRALRLHRYTDGDRIVHVEIREVRRGIAHLRVESMRVSQVPGEALEWDTAFARSVIERIARVASPAGSVAVLPDHGA